jgi:hypothetical protein
VSFLFSYTVKMSIIAIDIIFKTLTLRAFMVLIADIILLYEFLVDTFEPPKCVASTIAGFNGKTT